MSDYFAAGGPFMWPILILVAGALLQSVRYIRSPRTRHFVTALGAASCALIVALISLLTGFQHAIGPVRVGDERAQVLYLHGLSESLNGLVLALSACFVIAILLTIGAYRHDRRHDPESVGVAPRLDEKSPA